MTGLSNQTKRPDTTNTSIFRTAGDDGAPGLFGIGLPAAAGPRRRFHAVSLPAPQETPQPEGIAPTSRSEEETVPDPSRPQERP